jgi:hypothetical protein
VIAEAPPMRESDARRESHQETCRNHKRFLTYGAARAHYIEQLRANTTDPGQDVYRCARCRGWHHGGGVHSLQRAIEEAGGDDCD